MRAKGVYLAQCMQALKENFSNYYYGYSTPPEKMLPAIRQYFGLPKPPPEQPDALSLAVRHDRALIYKAWKRYDPEDMKIFGAAFSACVDAWTSKRDNDQPAPARLNITPKLFNKFREGGEIPHLSMLRRLIEKMELTPSEARPMIDAVFKAQRLGAYETPRQVVADMENITDPGKLLSRLRLASLKTREDIAQAVGLKKALYGHYERGIGDYSAHAEALAKALLPDEKDHAAFLAAVKRLHPVKSMEEIFFDLNLYPSTHDAVMAMLAAQGKMKAALCKHMGYSSTSYIAYNEENVQAIADFLELTPRQRQRLAEFARDHRKEHKALEELSLSDRAMTRVFSNLDQFPDCKSLLNAIQNASGISFKEMAKRCKLTSETAHSRIDRKGGYVPDEEFLRAWAYAAGLSSWQTAAVTRFADEKRLELAGKEMAAEAAQAGDRSDRAVYERLQPGEFKQLLIAYLAAHDEKKTDVLPVNSHVQRVNTGYGMLLPRIIKITKALGFNCLADFVDAARSSPPPPPDWKWKSKHHRSAEKKDGWVR